MRADIDQWGSFDTKLRELGVWLEEVTGFEFTITSPHRFGDPGVHGTDPTRGLDLRCRNKSLGKNIEALVNGEWAYDPFRPGLKCCLLHGEGSNLHLHLQVHPNTKRV